MKKIILIALAAIHVCISITIFIIGNKYEFTGEYTNTWLANLFVSLLLLVVFIISKDKVIKKISNLLLMIYPIGLVLISFIIFYKLPNFTYLEAKEIIIKETSEEIDLSKEDEIKGQLGMYYIYTREHVYIFNSEDGKYSKRKNLNE
ncbi:hypothetical protein [Lysinibacillus pakistanensis]|uniref:hypothetical protein n=1 Tax=Lysinibacillus pakistanensis TaxID=759811 RepID=UPI003D2E5E0C